MYIYPNWNAAATDAKLTHATPPFQHISSTYFDSGAQPFSQICKCIVGTLFVKIQLN